MRSQSYVRAWARCEYENGYLIFDGHEDYIEVWRLASDFAGDNEGASDSPPDEGQRRESTFATAMHHQYAPHGHFRPWAKLSFPEPTLALRFAYPTLLCANNKHAFLHDVRTGALVQTIDFSVECLQELEGEDNGICYVDVNERYAFVCEPRALHVFARDGGAEVLRIPRDALMSKVVEVDNIAGLEDPFVAVLPLSLWGDKYHCSDFLAGALPPPSLFSHRFYYQFTCSVQQSDDDSYFFDSTCIQGWSRSRNLDYWQACCFHPGL